ncbi:hypothetical protein BJ986_000261 [Phycicoccus badiiscoriae]|uniref:NERD domain-containing protein n=1 Tax=Pedococcus badiiscoriae TaxID=642776 RepID=A0A852WGJ0_9MICO|nr:nuclease-related domain-containing protein [Pedococcus badiiscoriae]NYG05774.1 hypothetical protein [Pedococcus badiiscoriae]
MPVGGGSADRRADALAASGDAAAAAAWAAGAAGERRVAAELSNLREAWTVLHDRLLRPGQSEANLDHVVVGPGGMFLIDAKNWRGNVTEYEGGLYQHVGTAEVRTSHSKAVEIAKVHGMAAYMAVESGMAVTPVICLAGAGEADFGEPQSVRGVWVVPVSKVVAWLESRPQIQDRDAAARAVTVAMTSFPSTTTDPELLSAMGAAAAQIKSSRRRGARPSRSLPPGRVGARRPVTTSGRRRPSLAARIGKLMVSLLVPALTLLLLVTFLPKMLTIGVERLVQGAVGVQPSGLATHPSGRASSTVTADSGTIRVSPSRDTKRTVVKSVPPPDCANASASQIQKIIGRRVQPIAVSTGCAWGSRLDDPSTTLVTIQMSPGHAAYDMQLEASMKQRRVVYGGGYDASFKPATALWVATGAPIINGSSTVSARADTHIVVARTALGISDDTGRRMALAIAAAVNVAR